jgi:hypothetical protein
MRFCPRCHASALTGDQLCWQCGRGLDEPIIYRTDFSRQDLIHLGLSPKFADFVFLEPKPYRLRYRCESRHSGWVCFVPDDVEIVYPLWTCNADVTALWVRQGRQEFVNLYHDDPETLLLANTEQGLLLHLFLALLESEDWNNPAQALGRLEQLAEIAGFRCLKELHEWHQQLGPGCTDFEERWKRFLASLDKPSV